MPVGSSSDLPTVGVFSDPGAVDGPLYETDTTVLQEGTAAAEVCVGVVMQSLPPQCGGPPIVNWDWAMVENEESAGDVTWGDYSLTGRFDGERFAVVEVAVSSSVEPSEAHPDPSRSYPPGRLKEIQFYLDGQPAEKRFGYQTLWSSIAEEEGVVEMGVVIVTRTMQRALAERYGEGVIRLFPQFHRLRG